VTEGDFEGTRDPGWSRVPVRSHALVLAIAWTLVVSGSLALDYFSESRGAVNSARQSLFASYQQVLFRHWIERHGGVCGLETAGNASTVCMESGAREIITPSGRHLRLVSPSEVSRDAFGSLSDENTIHGHLTSLAPVDKLNAPDGWERAALTSIANGSKEVSGVERVDGRNYLRLMRPLLTTTGCLQCHGAQGYRLGDIRGGITVLMPLAPFEAGARERMIPITLGHAGIWAAGMCGLLGMSSRLRKKVSVLEQTRQALRESEGRYRTLVEESPLGIYRTTPDGRILFTNQALLNMLGYASLDEIVGRSLEDTFAPGSGRAEFCASVERVGEVRGFRSSWKRRDGSVVEVRESATVIAGSNGVPACHQGVVEDITDQARAAEQFRNLVEGAPAGIFVVEDGCFQYLNPAALTIFGATGAEQLIGQPVLDHIHPACREAVVARIHALTQEGRAAPILEEIYLRLDGTSVPVEVSAVPLSREKLDRAVVFFRDITRQKAAQAEHEGLEAQLRQAQKLESVGRLAGGVAHDFNNLLTIINGYSAMVVEQLESFDPLRDPVLRIHHAGERAAELTAQLLAFSRKQVINPKVIDLNQMIADTRDMLQRLLGEDVELVTRLAADLGRVMLDAGQFHQILMNLAANARDAMSAGGRLEFETANVDLDENHARLHPEIAPGPFVMLSVTDNGSGLSQDARQHLFEPFFTTKGVGKGTGLGLSMVYGIVRQNGGSIAADSEPGCGTRFTVYLPRVEAEASAPVPVTAVRAAHGGAETILVVEDQEGVRHYTAMVLARSGYRVLEAASGKDALKLAAREKKRIHLLLTDVVMPGITGRDLAVRMLRLNPNMKVIYMSGYTADAIESRGLADLGQAYLAKPFTPDLLVEKVRQVLEGRPDLQLNESAREVSA